jgi:hypothetical protein
VNSNVALYFSGSRAASVAIGCVAEFAFTEAEFALVDKLVFTFELATGVRWQAPKVIIKTAKRRAGPKFLGATGFISGLSKDLRESAVNVINKG